MRGPIGEQQVYLETISGSPDDTFRIGTIIGEKLRAGDVVALIGELGSGKTCLTGGIAKGLKVSDRYRITSPTFTLVNEYPGRLALYHVDVYRLQGSADLVEMGYEDFLYSQGVTVIEWAEKITDILPEDSLCIAMAYVSETERRLRISGGNQSMPEIAKALKNGGC